MRLASMPALAALLACMGCTWSAQTPEAFVAECWGAVPAVGRAGEHEISFDAIIIPASPHGTAIFGRTRRCPSHRLIVTSSNPTISVRLQELAEGVLDQPIVGQGIRVRARIALRDVTDEYHLTVDITELASLVPMTAAETQQFIGDFQIG